MFFRSSFLDESFFFAMASVALHTDVLSIELKLQMQRSDACVQAG